MQRERRRSELRCRFVSQSIKKLIISRGIRSAQLYGRGKRFKNREWKKIMERERERERAYSESRQCEIIGSNAAIGK